MEHDPRMVLAEAMEALRGGAMSLERINAIIAANTDFSSLTALQEGVAAMPAEPIEPAPADAVGGARAGILDRIRSGILSPSRAPAPPGAELPPGVAEAQARLSAGGGSALGDFLAQTGQGAAFQFGDELVGAIQGPEAGAEFRQRTEDLNLLAPGASLAAGAAGGLLPTVTGGSVTAEALKKGASGPIAGALGGLFAGGTAGALTGAGAAEGDIMERLKAAVLPGLLGSGLGLATGGFFGRAGSTAGRPSRGRGARTARELGTTARVGRDTETILRVTEQFKERTRVRLFSPFDRKFPEVVDGPTHDFIARLADDPQTKGLIRAWDRNVADGNKFPSFRELQNLRTRLRKSTKGLLDERDELTDLMDGFAPGFKEANRIFGEEVEISEQVLKGLNSYNKEPGVVSFDLSHLRTDRAREMFRRGRVLGMMDRLSRRDEEAVSVLKTMMDAGPSERARLRLLFPTGEAGDAGFRSFGRELRAERSAAELQRRFRALGGNVARLVGLGAGLGIAQGLFDANTDVITAR